MKPYTYLLKHNPTNTFYYGVRYQNVKKKIPIVEDLWTRYFTSCNKVKKLIEDYGADSFDFEIRKVFKTPEQATDWEKKVLRRMNVLHDDKWLNANIAGYIIPTEESCKKISDFHKDVPKTEEHKKKIALSNTGVKRPWARSNLPADCSGENNGMYNKHHKEDSKRKIGEANKGKVPVNKGIPMSQEQIDKIKATKAANPYKFDPEVVKRKAEKQRGQTRDKKHCLHCNRMIAVGWYDKTHGDKCKKRTTN